MRRRLARVKRRFSGSTSNAFAEAVELIWYVFDSTIARTSFFTDQPSWTKRVARWSRRAGFDGRSPVVPNVSGVRTMPEPVSQCQARFAKTRAVRGFSFD